MTFVEKQEEELLIDFKTTKCLSFTKPISFSYFGDNYNIKNWTQLYVQVVSCILDSYPNVLSEYLNKNINGKSRIDFADESTMHTMIAPKKIADNFYLETNHNAGGIVSKIRQILDICSINYNNLKIRYITKNTTAEVSENNENPPDGTIDKTKQKISLSQPIEYKSADENELSEETISKYTNILVKYFGKSGYQLDRAIFKGRFKHFYAMEYDCDVPDSDDKIDAIISQAGTYRNGRIFPKEDEKQSSLIEEIITDIIAAFNDGASAVYIEAVYDKYQQQLADRFQIYNVDALTSLLMTNAKGRFLQKHSYLTISQNKADSANDVLRIMKGFHQPQNYEEIHKRAWYIPYDKMKRLLSSNKSIVNIAAGTYFYAPNLPVNADEIEQLTSIIQAELNYRSYINTVDMMNLIHNKCPSIAINTREYTTYGLRNCLGYILKDKFTFKGSIISTVGNKINMSDMYAEFAKSHENLSFDDLKNFSNEIHAEIYWNSIIKEMVRVSDKKMVRRDLIKFDVDKVDAVLEEICPDAYMPLKDISFFLCFPNIGYQWNEYVLESYLFNESEKFKLIHNSFAQNGVYGAMVRIDSPITNYRTLIVDVLSSSDALDSNALDSTKSALQYIVKHGFQHKRQYEGIEQIIQEAKLMNKQKEK